MTDQLGYTYHLKGTILKHIKNNVVYICVPKTGIMLFSLNLFNREANNLVEDIHYLKSLGYIITASVRNPFTRITSQYSEINKCREVYKSAEITKKLPFYSMVGGVERYKQFLIDIQDNFYEPHLLTQNYLLEDYIEIIDYFFIFEDIQHDVIAFNEKYGKKLYENFKVVNRSPNKRLQHELITTSTRNKGVRALIEKQYGEDIELYSRVLALKANE